MSWWDSVGASANNVASVSTLGLYDPYAGQSYDYSITPSLISDDKLIEQIQANAALDYSNTAAAYYSSMQQPGMNPMLTQYNMSNGLATASQGINANTANQVAQLSYNTVAFNANAINSANQFNSQMAYNADQMEYAQNTASLNRLGNVVSGLGSAAGSIAGAYFGAGGSLSGGGGTPTTGGTSVYSASGPSSRAGLWGAK